MIEPRRAKQRADQRIQLGNNVRYSPSTLTHTTF
jgi:hypothetical protein